MINYQLTIFSKNKKSIKYFRLFLKKKLKNLNFKIINKKSSKKTGNKKKISILKSPHVNKKAQEQFEFNFFKSKILINSTQRLKIQILLKKLKFKLFYDLKITIKTIINYKKYSSIKVNNFKVIKKNEFKNSSTNLNNLKKKLQVNFIKTTNLFKNTDLFGELQFLNKFR